MDERPKSDSQAIRDKDHFLALLGHEMRNPLGALRNALELIERHPDADVRRRQLKIAHRQVEDMSRLAEDLLDASRIDAGKLQLKPEALDLRLETYRLIESWRPELTSAGLELVLEGPQVPEVFETVAHQPVAVEADRTRLRQMVGNLLSNARKFTQAGGRITVRLSTEGNQAILSVQDTGCGMDPAEIERLFDAFEQSEKARELMTGGLGLGLPIVRGLARAHGGDLVASSEGTGHGSCFTLSLPMTEQAVPWASETGAMYVAALGSPSPPQPATPRIQALEPTETMDPFRGSAAVAETQDTRSAASIDPTPASSSSTPPKGSASKGRIMLIDDHQASAEGLAELLRLEGLEVVVFHGGREALESLDIVNPAAVVCDLGLPIVDGFEVARTLRRTAGDDLLLIALSGYVDAKTRSKAELAGFDCHLAKPVQLDRLLALLR